MQNRLRRSFTRISFGLFLSCLSFGLTAAYADSAPPLIIGQDLRMQNNQATVKIHPLVTGKVASAVVFLSAKCPCSNSHVTELNSLAKEFPTVQFVAVHSNGDESLDMAERYFKSADLSFPAIQDESFKLADQFKALKTPHAFLINSTGEIVYRGGVTNSSNAAKATAHPLREVIQDLVAGKKVRTESARTLGCAISRDATLAPLEPKTNSQKEKP